MQCSICLRPCTADEMAKKNLFYLRSWCKVCENTPKLTRLAKRLAKLNSSLASKPLTPPSSAKARPNREWNLTRDEYKALVAKPCNYCVLPLGPTGVRLDRLDNEKGYVTGNVVPCCTACNIARNRNFTPAEMVSYLGPAIRAAKLARSTEPPTAGGNNLPSNLIGR